MPVKVGIVGLGAIGTFLIEKIIENKEFEIVAVYDILPEKFEVLAEHFDPPALFCPIEDFPPDTDVFIECASVDAVEKVVSEAVSRGKTVIVASIGGLINNASLWERINMSDGSVILPSGAIGGLDILKALEKDDIEEVSLTTRKNPRSLPVQDDVTQVKEIFTGSALDAVKKYPKNINVAALLSIAGIGADKTRVRILSDPDVKHNTHVIDIKTKFGNYRIQCENFPFEANPKSSKLAALSIWAALKSVKSRVTFGL